MPRHVAFPVQRRRIATCLRFTRSVPFRMATTAQVAGSATGGGPCGGPAPGGAGAGGPGGPGGLGVGVTEASSGAIANGSSR